MAAPPATTTPDFTISATPASQSSDRGRSVTYTLQLTSLLADSPFTGTAALSAGNLPAGVTASFSPSSVVPGASQPAGSTMTLTIPAVQAQLQTGLLYPVPSLAVTFGSALLGLLLYQRRGNALPKLLSLFLLLGMAATAAAITGCGSGNGFAIPTTTTNITVTATSGTTIHSTTVALTIQ